MPSTRSATPSVSDAPSAPSAAARLSASKLKSSNVKGPPLRCWSEWCSYTSHESFHFRNELVVQGNAATKDGGMN
jgi:hypothetical protein